MGLVLWVVCVKIDFVYVKDFVIYIEISCYDWYVVGYVEKYFVVVFIL